MRVPVTSVMDTIEFKRNWKQYTHDTCETMKNYFSSAYTTAAGSFKENTLFLRKYPISKEISCYYRLPASEYHNRDYKRYS